MPLNPTAKFDNAEKKEFDLLPVGTYLVEVKDVEEKEDTYEGKTSMKLNFTFTVLSEKFKGRLLWRNTPTWTGSAILQEIFSAILNRTVVPEEITPESTNALIGKRLQVLVGTKAKQKGGLKNVIVNFLPDPVHSDIPFGSVNEPPEFLKP